MVYIVIGGAGYIGSHTIDALLKGDKKVICIDTFINSFPTIFSEMNNLENLEIQTEFEYNKLDKVDAIFHFGALKSISESFNDPISYYDNNLSATARALELMVNTNCNTFVYASSSAVYSGGNGVYSENDLPNPTSPYGRITLACEKLIQDIAALYPTKKFIILRYFNPYGGLESPKLMDHMNLFPTIQKALKEGTTVKLFGNAYKTPDGYCIRDFVHITDVVKAHILCLTLQTPGYHIFNIGTGKPVSVLQVVTLFRNKYHQLRVDIAPARLGDNEMVVANVQKASTQLGWIPRVEMGLNVI